MDYIRLHFPEDKYDVEIVVFEDEGFSGGNFNRPDLHRFLTIQKENPFNVLVCYRLDRISRNIAEFSNLMQELTAVETSFISIKEQFDTTTPMGRAMMYIASVFAQLEREVIAERIRDNMLELAKTGIWLGGDPPTGFKSERFEKVSVCEADENNIMEKKSKKACKLIVFEEEMKDVFLIHKKFKELKSLVKVETYLMQNDILTRNGKYYSVQTIKALLTSLVYVQNDEDTMEYLTSRGIKVYAEDDGRSKFDGKYGYLTYHKTSNRQRLPMEEWIIAVGLHQGQIPGKEWVETQLLLEKNRDKSYCAAGSTNPKKQTIVRGLIKCKACAEKGITTNMRPRNTDVRRPDGSVAYRYSCVIKEKSKGHKCQSDNIAGEKLDNKIIDIIRDIFVPNSEIYQELKKMAIAENTDSAVEELELLKISYSKIQAEIKKFIDKIPYVDIELMEMINSELKKLKEKKADVEKQIEELERNIKNNVNTEAQAAKDIINIIDYSFKIFDTFDLKSKRDIAGLFIESIYGSGEDIEINLLNTKIDDLKKKVVIPTVSVGSRLSSDTCLSDDLLTPTLPTQRTGKISP